MAKSPDEIEREIKQRREFISQHIGAVQERVLNDVGSFKSGVKDSARRGAGNAREGADVRKQVERHPMSMVAGAFGTGVALGIASGSRSNGHRATEPEPPPRRSESRAGILDSLAAAFMDRAGGTVQDELRQVLREGLNGFMGRDSPEPQRAAGEDPEARLQRARKSEAEAKRAHQSAATARAEAEAAAREPEPARP
ncbi:MAG TPA: hypothetical protein VH951_03535 [Dehalococcoidia bacterium]